MLEIWGLISKLTVAQMCWVQQIILSSWKSEKSSAHKQWREASQVQPVKPCNHHSSKSYISHYDTPWWKGVQVHTMQPCNYISSKPQKSHPIGLIGLLWQFLQLQTSYSLGTLYEGPRYEYKICKCKWVMDAQTYMGRCYHLVQFNLADHLKKHKDSS